MRNLPLTDEDRAVLENLSQTRLAGQRPGFLIGVHVFILGLAALVFFLTDPAERDSLEPMVLPGLPVVIVVGYALYLWARYRTRALRADLRDAAKHRLAGPCEGLVAREGRLLYTVGGQQLAVRPVLTTPFGLLTHAVEFTQLQAAAGQPVEVDFSAHDRQLLAVRYPDMPARVRLHPRLGRDDWQRLWHKALTNAAIVAAMLAAVAGAYVVWGYETRYLPSMAIILVLVAMAVTLVPFWRQPWVEAEGPVSESISARWHTSGEQRYWQTGHWGRVGGWLFPLPRAVPVGTWVRVRAGWIPRLGPGGLLELDELPPPPAAR